VIARSVNQVRDSIDIGRRALFTIPFGIAPALLVACRAPTPDSEHDDWPAWAPGRAAHYARLDELKRSGRDIREFGASLDGTSDASDALERAADAAPILLIPGNGVLRITRQIPLNRPIAILGIGSGATISVETPQGDLFLANALDDDPAGFLKGLHLDGLRFVRPAPLKPHGTALSAFNLRDASVTRCTSQRMGLLELRHTRQRLRLYDRTTGSVDEDPALKAGFSARPDDLSEDILVYDNAVDGEAYMSQIVRFEFARRVAIAGNTGKFANISWWGGGARRNQGGDIRHLRRVRDVYIADNRVSGANGGVYGNNGDGIVVARNIISLMTDVGIDFEGCFNALAYGNQVSNVGNYCFATFYAARNVEFRDNIGIQDGSATNLHLRFGRGKYGAMAGTALFGMRSAGFATPDTAIDVRLIGNRFNWQGKAGTGRFVASYFGRLEMVRNQLENVTCNLAYRRTGSFIARDNRLAFDRRAPEPINAITSSATRVDMRNNEIRSSVAQPVGSSAILVDATAASISIDLTGNRAVAPDATLPITLRGPRPSRLEPVIRDNQSGAVFVEGGAGSGISGNKDDSGAALTPRDLPLAYRAPSASGPSPSEDGAPASPSPDGDPG
jgi:hypothetical protein